MADECAGKDTDERKATCEPAVPLGGDTLGHVEYVRAAELRIRAGVRKAFQAFVNNKLPAVRLDTYPWKESWTEQQRELLEFWDSGRHVVAEFDSKVRQHVFLDGKPLPATTKELLHLPSAKPSPFGDLTNGTTVVDTSVRDSVEFTNVSIAPNLAKELADRFSAAFHRPGCVVECYKLCVHGKGVGFQSHQDTPLPGMIGTAVLELTRTWERHGGDLKFHIKGKEHVARLNTVLFLPFVHHEVTPIKDGFRVSVLCRVYRTPSEGSESPSPGQRTLRWLDNSVDEDGLPLLETDDDAGDGRWGTNASHRAAGVFEAETASAAMKALLRTTQRPRRLFLLAHNVYSASQMQRLMQPAEMLMGRDRDLYVQLLADKDLHVWVTPAVRVEATEEDADVITAQCNVGYFDDGYLRAAIEGKGVATTMPKHAHLAALFDPDDRVDMVAHHAPKSDDGFCLLSESQACIEHTGNQSQEGYENNLYYAVAIVVQQADTPRYGEDVVRARVAAARAAAAGK